MNDLFNVNKKTVLITGSTRGLGFNIALGFTRAARPTTANYCAAKGGLLMLTKAMATEWGKYNIQVNAIGPGYF